LVRDSCFIELEFPVLQGRRTTGPPFKPSGDRFMTLRYRDRIPIVHFKKIVTHVVRGITSEQAFNVE